MAFNGTQTRTWDETTPNDGDLLNLEFARLYANDNDLNTQISEKVPIAAIVNNLTSGGTAVPLSAEQGKTLNTNLNIKAKQLGEVFQLYGNLQNPGVSFPAFCIAKDDFVVLDANWPTLGAYLRSQKLVYDELGTPQSSFTITTWALASGVVTVTFANLTPESKILRSLHQDAFVHANNTTVGEADTDFASFVTGLSNWRTITLTQPLRNNSDATIVPAGTYEITAIVAGNAAAGQLKFAYSASDVTGKTENRTCEFYPHLLHTLHSNHANGARWFKVAGRTLYSADGGIEYAGGLRKRNTMQGHWHRLLIQSAFASTGGIGNNPLTGYTYDDSFVTNVKSDGTNGTPRVASKTTADSLGVYMYLFGGGYVA